MFELKSELWEYEGLEKIFISSDKILSFKWKLNLWKKHVAIGIAEMFLLLLVLEREQISS